MIGRDELINDDLYVAGNTVTIDGTVKGDVVAVASQITINGTVEGDLLLLWLMPAWTRRLADSVEAKPLPTLGWGLVVFVAFVAGVLGILIATIILAIIFGYLTLGGLVAMIIGLGMLANAALVISYIRDRPRTVEMRVANILAILDSRSRAEAVRRAAELDQFEEYGMTPKKLP